MGSIRSAVRWAADTYVLFVVLGLVVGAVLVPPVLDVAGGPDGTVAVVPIDGTIDGETATAYTAMLQRARQDPNVEAVVIVSNSGGGSAAASEEMYMATKRTAATMPVVTAVDAGAASGAYYTVAPSDRIYVKPSSFVGSVGVLAQLPPTVEPNDIIATTGPNKLTGGDAREFYHELELLQAAFLNAVYQHRGDELELSRSEVARAGTYVGVQAVENGLADAIGDREAAVRHAAELAGLDRYQVRVLRPDNLTAQFAIRGNYLASDAPDKEMVGPRYFLGQQPTGPTYVMVPAAVLADGPTGPGVVGTYGDRLAPAADLANATEADLVTTTEVDQANMPVATPASRVEVAG